jgi:hypothetical protein
MIGVAVAVGVGAADREVVRDGVAVPADGGAVDAVDAGGGAAQALRRMSSAPTIRVRIRSM